MMRVNHLFKSPWEWRWWWGWRRRVICWTRCSYWWRPPSGSCSPPSSARLSPAHQGTLARSPKIRWNNTRCICVLFRFPAYLGKVDCFILAGTFFFYQNFSREIYETFHRTKKCVLKKPSHNADCKQRYFFLHKKLEKCDCAAEAIFCCPTENSHHLKS